MPETTFETAREMTYLPILQKGLSSVADLQQNKLANYVVALLLQRLLNNIFCEEAHDAQTKKPPVSPFLVAGGHRLPLGTGGHLGQLPLEAGRHGD